MAAYVKNLASFINGTNGATKTITLSASPTAGNMGTIAINTNGLQTISSITDSAGNTYNVRNAGGSNVDQPHIADVDFAGVPTTVTITLSGASAQWCVSFDEWSGVSTSQYDGTVFAEANGTNTSPTVTPAKAASLVIGFEGHHTGATPVRTYTQTGSFTKDNQVNKGSGQFDSIVVSHDASGTGPHAFSGTLSGAVVGWDALTLGYQVSSGIVLVAPVATVSVAGVLGAPVESASAPVASVSVAGQLGSVGEVLSAPVASVSVAGGSPLARMVLSAPVAQVIVTAFPGFIPTPKPREWNSWFRPIVEPLFPKWGGFVRVP